jgi:hypothetical protein
MGRPPPRSVNHNPNICPDHSALAASHMANPSGLKIVCRLLDSLHSTSRCLLDSLGGQGDRRLPL